MRIKVKVIPNAKKERIEDFDGGLKIYVNKPALDGKANARLLEILAVYFNVKKTSLEIIKGQLKPLAGVHEFIEECKSRDKKIAIASSADLRKVRGNLAEIGYSLDFFDAVVTGEDVKHKKPDPEIFLTAAQRLGLAAR